MRLIGITGGIASGKTTLANALSAAGANVIDADHLSRQLTANGGAALPGIRSLFGDAYFYKNGELNRAALGEAVFGNYQALQRLNAFMFPLIRHEIESRLKTLADRGGGIVFLEAPLLYEAEMDHLCNEVWCTFLPKREQQKRLMARDGLTRSQALRRIGSQMPLLQKARLADKVIRTDRSLNESTAAIVALYEQALGKGPL